jgi:hypothetical protein
VEQAWRKNILHLIRDLNRRVRRLEIRERPAAGGSTFSGAVFWRNTNQAITGTTSGGASITWNRSAGDASFTLDGSDASKVLMDAPGWYRAVFNGRAQMTTNGLTSGKVRASIGWRDIGNDDHRVSQISSVPPSGLMIADWSVVTPPVYISAISGETVSASPQPYFYGFVAFEGMTNPGTLTALGQDDSLLDAEGYPVEADVMRFSVEKL